MAFMQARRMHSLHRGAVRQQNFWTLGMFKEFSRRVCVAGNIGGAALAAHTMAVIQGLSTWARDGATRDKRLQVAAVAMRAWPETL